MKRICFQFDGANSIQNIAAWCLKILSGQAGLWCSSTFFYTWFVPEWPEYTDSRLCAKVPACFGRICLPFLSIHVSCSMTSFPEKYGDLMLYSTWVSQLNVFTDFLVSMLRKLAYHHLGPSQSSVKGARFPSFLNCTLYPFVGDDIHFQPFLEIHRLTWILTDPSCVHSTLTALWTRPEQLRPKGNDIRKRWICTVTWEDKSERKQEDQQASFITQPIWRGSRYYDCPFV